MNRQGPLPVLFSLLLLAFGGVIGYLIGSAQVGRQCSLRYEARLHRCLEKKRATTQHKAIHKTKTRSSLPVRRITAPKKHDDMSFLTGPINAPTVIVSKQLRAAPMLKPTVLKVFAALPSRSFTYAENEVPSTLHPYLARKPVERRLARLMFEPLIGKDHVGRPIPMLASSWKRLDDKTLRLRLREKVVWHDGHAFTAYDVGWTISCMARLPQTLRQRRLLQALHKVVLVDRSTVEFVFKTSPSAPLPLLDFPILPKRPFPKKTPTNEDFMRAHRSFGKKPLGTGAFQLHSWRKARMIRLKRTLSYWRRVSPQEGSRWIGNVNAQVIPSREVQAGVFNYGALQGMLHLLPHEAAVLKDVSNANIHRVEGRRRQWVLWLNHEGLLGEYVLRKALSMSLPRDVLAKLYTPRADQRSGPLGAAMKSLYAPEKAEALLDKAGWKMTVTGFRDRMPELLSLRMILCKEWKDMKKMFDVIERSFHKLGVRMEVKWLSRKEWERAVYEEREFDITFMTHQIDDLRDLMRYLHHAGDKALAKMKGRVWETWFEKTYKGRHVSATALRQQFASHYDKTLPFLFLWSTPAYVLLDKSLMNVVFGVDSLFSFVDRWHVVK